VELAAVRQRGTRAGRIAALAPLALAAACHGGPDRGGSATRSRAPAPFVADTAARAPAGARVIVEVLNGTRKAGFGRRATLYLRAMGYDVVAMGNSRGAQDNTVVLDRSHHPQWSARLAAAVHGRSLERPDTSRYLDATVVIGNDWTPPPLPLDP